MKIAITAKTQGALGMLEPAFDRTPYFLVFDTEFKTWGIHTNRLYDENDADAGVQSAQNLRRTGAAVLVTGQVGAKALIVLQSDSVKIYKATEQPTNEALNRYLTGGLEELSIKELPIQGGESNAKRRRNRTHGQRIYG